MLWCSNIIYDNNPLQVELNILVHFISYLNLTKTLESVPYFQLLDTIAEIQYFDCYLNE